MADKKEIRRLIEQARTWAGWRVVETKGGWMVYPADKSFPGISIHGTPSDHRMWQNTISRLRRAGAPV